MHWFFIIIRKKLISLVSQKFIADVANDALQYNRVKQQNANTHTSKDKRKEKKVALTMEDLSAALSDYGVNVKKPSYYIWRKK